MIFNFQQNTEYKKKIETLTAQINEVNIKTAADQQHIQQLVCKIKDIEGDENDKIIQYDLEKSSLQGMLYNTFKYCTMYSIVILCLILYPIVKIKELEQELRNVKKSYETKIKKIEKKVPIKTENSELI